MGRRPSNAGNPKATKKSSQSATKINKDIEISKLTYEEPEKRLYYCTACGKSFKKQDSNFCKSLSPLFAGNNGYVHICKKCTDKLYYNLVDYFSKNEEKAMDRMCQLFDWYYSDEIFAATRKISADRSRVCAFPAKSNLPQYNSKGKTYVDTIADRATNTIDSFEELERIKTEAELNDEVAVSDRTVKRWGLGYSETEYQMLNDHYKVLKDKIGDDDVKDSLIKDLCEQHILKYRARQDKDYDRYEKMSKLYQQTLSTVDLKPKNTEKNVISNNPDECWGVFQQIVENYSPAEFIKEKDKKVFKDYNEQDEYYRRFIIRPTENLLNGTTTMDEEYSIKVEDDD